MYRIRVLSVCCFVAIVLGCGGIGGRVHEQKLVEDIELRATDERAQMELIDNRHELVPATVFAAGWNDSHVIAKRHPREESARPPDKTRTEYFIVVVRTRKVHGPFDEAEYWMHRDFLNVAAGLGFTVTFRDLE